MMQSTAGHAYPEVSMKSLTTSTTTPEARIPKAWVLAATSIASLMVALDALVVATALGTMRRELGASLETLQWTMSGYNFSFAVLLLTGAALGDRFGRRRMFVVGLGVFVTASAACALADGVRMLIIARVVQGAGAALVAPLALVLLGDAFRGKERAKALGIYSGITGLALVAGPLLGGVIAEGFAWQWIFWINVPIGIVVMLVSRARLAESTGPSAAVDVLGVVLVTGAALGLVWGLSRGNSAGWSSVEVLVTLLLGGVVLAAFVAWELRVTAPMVPMRLFRSRMFSSTTVATFAFYGALYGCMFFLPQFFQVVQGQGPASAGLRLLPLTATLMVVAPMAGLAMSRFGERKLVVAGLLLLATGLGWIAWTASPAIAYASLGVPLVAAGTGVSIAIPASQHAVLGSVEPSEVGKASGILNMSRFLGGVFGIAIAVAMFSRHGSFGSAEQFSAGFVPAMGASVLLSLVGVAAGLAMRSTAGARRTKSTKRSVRSISASAE
jgi:EmrB/QacA subfamily drug resistance transporter